MRGFDLGVPMFMVNIAAVCAVKFYYHPVAMGLVFVVTAVGVATWASNQTQWAEYLAPLPSFAGVAEDDEDDVEGSSGSFSSGQFTLEPRIRGGGGGGSGSGVGSGGGGNKQWRVHEQLGVRRRSEQGGRQQTQEDVRSMASFGSVASLE